MCKIKPMNQVSNYTKITKYTKFKITLTNKNLIHSCSQAKLVADPLVGLWLSCYMDLVSSACQKNSSIL